MSQIITSTDLAAYMNKTLVDVVAQNVTDAINDWIENTTHRCWGETKNIIERYDWAPRIWLRHQDVQAITSVKLGYPGIQQSALDSKSYFFNGYGRVTMYLQNFRQFNPSAVNNDLVEIQYTYGVTNVPDDLKLAALGIAAGFYNWATTGPKDVVGSSVGSYRLEFIGKVRGASNGATNPANNTSEANWAIVASYRTRRQ